MFNIKLFVIGLFIGILNISNILRKDYFKLMYWYLCIKCDNMYWNYNVLNIDYLKLYFEIIEVESFLFLEECDYFV